MSEKLPFDGDEPLYKNFMREQFERATTENEVHAYCGESSNWWAPLCPKCFVALEKEVRTLRYENRKLTEQNQEWEKK